MSRGGIREVWAIAPGDAALHPNVAPEPGSHKTHRWSEMDSNFWYRGTKAVDFRTIPGIAGYRRRS